MVIIVHVYSSTVHSCSCAEYTVDDEVTIVNLITEVICIVVHYMVGNFNDVGSKNFRMRLCT